MSDNVFPKLHNAMWPGLVGKGPDSEPHFELDTMLDFTCAAEVDGQKFDGVDIFLFDPHVDIDISTDKLKGIADRIMCRDLVIGSVVAPIWEPTGGGAAMGSADEIKAFLGQVKKGCRIASELKEMGARPYGIVRLDTASSTEAWAKDPAASQKLLAKTLKEAADIAADHGEKLALEGEICWGGIHNWKSTVELLEMVDKRNLGFQADMAHTLLFLMGYNAPEARILPENFDWNDSDTFQEGLKTLTDALRPWTIDFHVAQNDGTVHGTGSHDKTGRHCLVDDPNGKLDVVRDAKPWFPKNATAENAPFTHICWDGCMFPNAVMEKADTWNNILGAMLKIRKSHGWS